MRGYQRVELHLHWRETFLRRVVRVGLESGSRAAVLYRLDVVYPYGELEVLRRLRFAQTDVFLFATGSGVSSLRRSAARDSPASYIAVYSVIFSPPGTRRTANRCQCSISRLSRRFVENNLRAVYSAGLLRRFKLRTAQALSCAAQLEFNSISLGYFERVRGNYQPYFCSAPADEPQTFSAKATGKRAVKGFCQTFSGSAG